MRAFIFLVLSLAILGSSQAFNVYLSASLGTVEWTGSCAGIQCTELTPCKIPTSGLISIPTVTECTLIIMDYVMPNWTLTVTSGDLHITSLSTITTTSAVSAAGFGWSISSPSKVTFDGFVAQLSAPFMVAATEVHIYNTTLSSSAAGDPSYGLIKVDSLGFTLLNITDSRLSTSSFRNLVNIGYSPSGAFNIKATSSNFTSLNTPTAGDVAIWVGIAASNITLEQVISNGFLPVSAIASSMTWNDTNAWNIPYALQTNVDELSLHRVQYSLYSTSVNFISGLPTIKRLTMVQVEAYTAVDNILIAVGGVECAFIKECSWSGSVTLNSATVTSNVSITIKDSLISATYPGQTGLAILGPQDHFVNLELSSSTYFSSYWNGWDIYLGGNISFTNPLVLHKVSHFDSALSFYGPSVEIHESLIGNAANILPIKFFCEVYFHSADLTGDYFFRDDQYYYIPSKLWRGLQVFPSMTVSQVTLVWDSDDTPAIAEPVTIAYNVFGITTFDVENNPNITVTGHYSDDGVRFVMTFRPVPCPAACASFVAISDGQSGSICSSKSKCPTRFFATTFTTSVNFNFGPVTAAANGTMNFGGDATFSSSFTMDSSSSVSISAHATVAGALSIGTNGTLVIGGSTSVSSDLTTADKVTISMTGDISLGSLIIGTESTFTGGGANFILGGSFNTSGSTVQLDSTQGTIQGSILILDGSNVSIPNSATFQAADFTLDQDSILIFTASSSSSTSSPTTAPTTVPTTATTFLIAPTTAPSTPITRKRMVHSELASQMDNSTALINVTGCANISGTIHLNISSQDVNNMPAGQRRMALLYSQAGCITSANLLVASYSNGNCKTISSQGVSTSQIGSGTVLNALFSVDDSGCPAGGSPSDASSGSPDSVLGPNSPAHRAARTWPIIVGVILGAVALGVIVAIILFIASPSCRRRVAPYSKAKTGSTGGSITRATTTSSPLTEEADQTSTEESRDI